MSNEIRGWKEIAAYLGVTDRTAQRWETELHLPVHRLRQGGSSPVFVHLEEIEQWRRSADGARAEAERNNNGHTADLAASVELPASVAPSAPTRTPPSAWLRRRSVAAAVASLCLLAAAFAVFVAARPNHPPERPATAKPPAERPPSGQRRPARVSIADSQFVVNLRVSFDDGSVFRTRSFEGEAIRVLMPSGTTYGIAPAHDRTFVRVAIFEVTQNGRGIETLGTLRLERGAPLPFIHGKDSFRVEWTGNDPLAARDARPADAPQTNCGMSCGTVAVQASEVFAPCGSCCDTDFGPCTAVRLPRKR